MLLSIHSRREGPPSRRPTSGQNVDDIWETLSNTPLYGANRYFMWRISRIFCFKTRSEACNTTAVTNAFAKHNSHLRNLEMWSIFVQWSVQEHNNKDMSGSPQDAKNCICIPQQQQHYAIKPSAMSEATGIKRLARLQSATDVALLRTQRHTAPRSWTIWDSFGTSLRYPQCPKLGPIQLIALQMSTHCFKSTLIGVNRVQKGKGKLLKIKSICRPYTSLWDGFLLKVGPRSQQDSTNKSAATISNGYENDVKLHI